MEGTSMMSKLTDTNPGTPKIIDFWYKTQLYNNGKHVSMKVSAKVDIHTAWSLKLQLGD